MEEEENIWTAKARSLLDTYLAIILSMIDVSENGRFIIMIPLSGGRFLISGLKVPIQIIHNDFEPIIPNSCPGYFVIATGLKPAFLHVIPGSHRYVFYDSNDLTNLSKVFKAEKFEIPSQSIFVGHGWVQHAGSGWTGSSCLRYHLYFVPDGYKLPDGIHFAYGKNLKTMS